VTSMSWGVVSGAMTTTERTWNEQQVERELRHFLAGQDAWPTYRTFERAGLKSLRDAVTRSGGAVQWARRLGIRYVAHSPGYAPLWTEDRIRTDLRDYLKGRDEWPSRAAFEADGRTALRNAVNRTGGPDRWAAEFGLGRKTRLAGVRRGWTREAIEAELVRFLGERTTWPSRREFHDAGLGSMLSSIYKHEGPAYWARRLGVKQRAPFGRPRTRYWTDERIRRELERFCAGRDIWPTETEFVEAGQRSLYLAASRNGGVARWADELGLLRRRPRPQPPGGR
jgi:hypothetical protein